jgi:ribosomal protein S18 acetylase RimI-like enzyme
MAALPEASGLRLVELSTLQQGSLNALLAEETERWSNLLDWDFRASADLVSRYAGYRALEGLALVDEGCAVGYSYWVLDERKGLIGDLYVRSAWRSPANELALLEGTLRQLRRQPWVRRVEAQLMQLGIRGPLTGLEPAPRRFSRHFMLARMAGLERLRPVAVDGDYRIEPWHMRHVDEAAELISRVYSGHVDSEINDQYKSAAGAMRFLQNIVQYPGCGQFAPECSLMALDGDGRARGMLLGTWVAAHSGHVAQICVEPELRGAGLGYELLRRGLLKFAGGGAECASLTVTAANRPAIRLYDWFGFRAVHHFDAYVWEPF